ncbi:hypothetical protein Pcinc_003657 [Petrolisthes cinctipes]|uniref:Uncharacterized protein n=1 Tax=Petrolisthes cinctipes TaxID=88211 RepID=A0AAE1GG59_PETCI|nr:hypothetical protein Pcinc_003657 [Petrolisthes cinctipes]
MWLVYGPLSGHNILLVTEDNNDDVDDTEIEDWRAGYLRLLVHNPLDLDLDDPPRIFSCAPPRYSPHHVYKLDHSPHLVKYTTLLSTCTSWTTLHTTSRKPTTSPRVASHPVVFTLLHHSTYDIPDSRRLLQVSTPGPATPAAIPALTCTKPSPPCSRLDHILAMPNYGSFVPDALRESDNPAYASLGKTLLLPPTVDSNDVISDLVPLLMKGDHAIIVTLDYVIYNWYKRNLTHFSYVLEERVYMGHMSWWFPQHTPYTATINTHLTNLLENGVLHKLYKNYVGSVVRNVKQVRTPDLSRT